MSEKLNDRYNPAEVESKTYQWWEDKNYFACEDSSTKPPFCAILPPPNVTGSLHLGHALDHTIQDVVVRWKRMSGYNTLWLPGTDHAGIATQSVVEKKLAKEGIKRKDLGREKFVEKIWEWKQEYGDRIVSQMKFLGNSCDWSKLTFTLDEGVSKAVKKVFVHLYNKGYIYQGTRLINWSPKLESALSDLEVDHKEVNGSLWHLKYPLADGSGEVIVATTRPETMLGDTAVAVHPEDERYTSMIGKKIKLPLTNREIPVIADDYVDKEFGTGVVKITPAHDFNDYEMGKRHNLEMINILNKDGTLNDHGGAYKGMKVQNARKQMVVDLEEQGVLDKVEPHKNKVGHCSRTGCVVEPYLSEQWFVKTTELAKPAKHSVENGTTSFEPELWTKTYLHWMNNIQDWCISRQLWWGHQIPAWSCSDCNKTIVAEDTPSECDACSSKNLVQEEDVLDTWFSSGLWPFTTLGWPEETDALKTFYPTDLLVTGHDIIFFWVARMMMSGLEFKGDVPFRKVYIHGLIRDSQGRKMSKSLNNSVDPVELIEKFGADALRFTLMSQLAGGRDLKFSMARLEGNRNFMNKLWNATRFSLSVIDGADLSKTPESFSFVDQWIIQKFDECQKEVNKHLADYRFSEASHAAYTFAWNDFCDWYLELSKPVVYGDDAKAKYATQWVLGQMLNKLMKLLHPFVPFITEEIYQKLPIKTEALIVAEYPTSENQKEFVKHANKESADSVELLKATITAIRNIRGENRIKPGEKIKVNMVSKKQETLSQLKAADALITKMANLSESQYLENVNYEKSAVSAVNSSEHALEVVIPLEGLVDFDEEIKRIDKNLEKLSKEINSLEGRLSNDNFLKNAPDEVVTEGKKQLIVLKQQKDLLDTNKSRFM